MRLVRDTPVTSGGLTQYDQLEAEVAAVKAWTMAGPNPVWHHRMQQVVRAQMPVLGRALDRLAEEITPRPCPTCQGPSRETVGMVCQDCGHDYGKDALSVDMLLLHAQKSGSKVDGFFIYTIKLRDFEYEILARPRFDGTYEIKEYRGRSL